MANLTLPTLRTAEVGMRIGPRLNAPGRLGSAALALELLLADNGAEADRIAAAIEEVNARRRELTQTVVDQARAAAAGTHGRAAVVVAGDGWPHGVVGIVAARLVEELGKPVVVIGFDGDEGRGSARTVPGLDLYRAIASGRAHLERFGGHAQAAGLTVRRASLSAFTEAFEAAVTTAARDAELGAPLSLDAELQLSQIDLPFAEELLRLEPCGIGNPEPCVMSGPIVLERSRVVGGDHLQVTFRDGGTIRDGIAFRFGARDPGAGARIRAAYVPEIDTYRGTRRLRLRVRDLRPVE
jgi:single-stranded-DNA-specific exonuclease